MFRCWLFWSLLRQHIPFSSGGQRIGCCCDWCHWFASFLLCERGLSLTLTLREEGQVELLGRRPTDLARVQACQPPKDSVNLIFRRSHDTKQADFQCCLCRVSRLPG